MWIIALFVAMPVLTGVALWLVYRKINKLTVTPGTGTTPPLQPGMLDKIWCWVKANWLVPVMVLACYIALWYCLPAVWSALIHSNVFWVDQLAILGFYLVKDNKKTWLLWLLKTVLILILLAYNGKALWELEEQRQIAYEIAHRNDTPPPPPLQVNRYGLVVEAPVAPAWSDKVLVRSNTRWVEEGCVLIEPSNGPAKEECPGGKQVFFPGTRWLRFQATTGKVTHVTFLE